MERIIIHHRSAHHAQNSGYARLIDYIEAKLIPSENSRLPHKVSKLISSQISSNGGIYDSISLQKDWELLKHLFFRGNKERIIHYLNGERDIRYSLKAVSLFSKTKVCATFHKPPEVLKKTISNTSYLKKIKGAIAVGINQVEFLQNWLDLEQVQFIPHGVDTSFFYPDKSVKKEDTMLFVGQHLRDFEALNYAIPRLKEKIPHIKINVVLRQDFAHKIISNSSVTIFSGINDESLRKLYQEATLLFLPLVDSTACNSILEAMACGLPVISSDVGGNYGYVKENCGLLIPDRDYTTLVDRTILLLKDQNDQDKMSANARLNALSYDWEIVAKNVNDFYNLMH